MGNTKEIMMSNKNHATNLLNLTAYLAQKLDNLTVEVIVELGARDCKETIALHETHPAAKILSFECNPMQLEECRNRVKDIREITLVEKAVSNKSGNISFFQIDTEKTETTWKDGNPGASSMFKASNKYEVEKYVQKEVSVECTTLYDELPLHKVSKIDLLWMDIQGSELNALKGLQNIIENVSVIHTEVEFVEIYEGQPLFWEIKKFLNTKGFYLTAFTAFSKNNSGDAVFVNAKLLNPIQRMKYALMNKILHPMLHYGVLSI